MKFNIKPIHIFAACGGLVVFGKLADVTQLSVFSVLFWICAVFLAGLALFQLLYPIYLNHSNTFRNVGYVLFTSTILTKYVLNFKDIVDQNGDFIAVCCLALLVLPVAFLTAKLIKEL